MINNCIKKLFCVIKFLPINFKNKVLYEPQGSCGTTVLDHYLVDWLRFPHKHAEFTRSQMASFFYGFITASLILNKSVAYLHNHISPHLVIFPILFLCKSTAIVTSNQSHLVNLISLKQLMS